ncbi:arginase family protein [Conexibacter woesei]|uniref:arginase family protein n=1 Tax=Conexibacter woesei TaxID=191495 RepID=UPI00041E8818|nr:arginase family protein [Conexibacter woesei]
MGDRFSYPPLALICWPFEAGTPDLGMGAGASLLAGDRELHDVLAACGWTPTLERIAASADPLAGEVTRIFDLLRAHALAVRAAVGRGAFPLVLSGGCISAAATVAGAGADGAVWFDAHADLDTPEDNLSGSMDVQALSIVTGSAWQASARAIPGFTPVLESAVQVVGVRDLADYQRLHLDASGVVVGLAPDFLPFRTYLHVDLDVLDADRVGRANRYACAGGPTTDEVLDAIDTVFDNTTVAAAALSAYEPRVDRSGSVRDAAHAIARRIATRAREQR